MFFQKIDYSFLKDTDKSSSGSDSEPEMFDNVLETSVHPQIIGDSDKSEDEDTPIKKPPPAKSKTQIIDDSDKSEDEETPIKKPPPAMGKPQAFDDSEKSEDEETPIKKPAPSKSKPAPGASKRKIISSDSEASPVKKKVKTPLEA